MAPQYGNNRGVSVGDDRWWELRDIWALPFVLLGSYGYRPRLTPERLLGYRRDGSTFELTGKGGQLPIDFVGDDEDDDHEGVAVTIALRDVDGEVIHTETLWLTHQDHAVAEVERFLADAVVREDSKQSGWTHTQPDAPIDQVRLGIAYATYRHYLDALAAHGVHAYLEAEGVGHRIYADISDELLLDLSIVDEGLDDLGPEDDYWVVFVTRPEGHEAEVMLPRVEDAVADADQLATAAINTLTSVLRDSPILLGSYDPETGRLDPALIDALRSDAAAAPWPPVVGGLLPGADQAYGVEEKLTRYSLNINHEGDGAAKANGFELILGITAKDVDYLAAELLWAPVEN